MNISVIDKLSWAEFEKFAKEFLNEIGFSDIERTKKSGDYGVDFKAVLNEEKCVIQCKRRNKNIGIKAVQEVFAGETYYSADHCMVISNREYTDSAIKLAETCGCKLIGRKDLKKWLNDEFNSSEEFLNFIENKKLKKFKIPTKELIEEYFAVKQKLKKQPTISDIDKCGKFSSSVYRKRWGTWNNFLSAINEKPLQIKSISKETLIKNFYEVKVKVGKVPTTVEMKRYSKYSISAYGRRFGSWNNFLKSINENLTKRHKITEEEFVNEFKRVRNLLGHIPTTKDMIKHGKIAPNSYKRIWGSWTNFLKERGENYQKRNIPEEDLIKEYLKLKKLLKKNTLTQKDMNECGKYSSSVYERRYGSWNKFLKNIGDDVNINTEILEKDLVSDYLRIKKILNKSKLSANDIKNHGKYSISTYLKRFGKWNDFLKKIGEIK